MATAHATAPTKTNGLEMHKTARNTVHILRKLFPLRSQTKSHVMAFLFASGQGLLVLVWSMVYLESWPAIAKLLAAVLWFTLLLAVILRFGESGAASRGQRHTAHGKATTPDGQPRPSSPARTAPRPVPNSSNLRLATMGHEMKTPLNAILGFSEILDREYDKSGSSKGREYARLIHESGRHLLSVVNGMLDLARIDSGTYQLDAENLCVHDLLERCTRLMGPLARRKSVRLLSSSVTSDLHMRADPRACRQMLINLLSNAIKFSPPGGEVVVAARRERDRVLISITDNGPGIKAADFDRLCEPFVQGEAGLERHHEGTGIGLSVVRGLAQLQKGRFYLAEREEPGTSLIIELPAADAQTQDGAPEKRAGQTPTTTKKALVEAA